MRSYTEHDLFGDETMTATASTHDLDMARIEALLRRLEPNEAGTCTVPGCLHLDHGAVDDAPALRSAA